MVAVGPTLSTRASTVLSPWPGHVGHDALVAPHHALCRPAWPAWRWSRPRRSRRRSPRSGPGAGCRRGSRRRSPTTKAPPLVRTVSSAYQPSAGLPMARDLAMVCGLHGPDGVGALGEGRGHRRAALGLGARHPDVGLLVEQAHGVELGEALGHLGELAARADRHDHVVGRLPAELLGDLEGEGLRPLGVVGADVDVDERPRRAARS